MEVGVPLSLYILFSSAGGIASLLVHMEYTEEFLFCYIQLFVHKTVLYITVGCFFL